MKRLTITQPVDVRHAWILWGVFAVVMVTMVMWPSHHRTVSKVFRDASVAWVAGEDLYKVEFHGFLYLPHAAILYVPFSLPSWHLGTVSSPPYPWPWFHLSEAMWRLACVGSLAWGVWRLSRLARQVSGVEWFALMTLLVIPVAADSARNGQMNLPMVAVMMLATAALGLKRWTWATVWLCLGLALKPLLIVMILLVAAVYWRPMIWRLAFGLIVLAAAPFLFQHPSYVLRQYQLCIQQMQVSSQADGHTGFSDFFGWARVIGWQASPMIQTMVRAGVAGLTLAACWLARKKHSDQAGAIFLFCLAACYLMLFNPRTENNSYAVLAPAIALAAADAFLVRRNLWVGWLCVGMTAVLSLAWETAALLHVSKDAVSPTVAILFVVVLVGLLWRGWGTVKPGDCACSSC